MTPGSHLREEDGEDGADVEVTRDGVVDVPGVGFVVTLPRRARTRWLREGCGGNDEADDGGCERADEICESDESDESDVGGGTGDGCDCEIVSETADADTAGAWLDSAGGTDENAGIVMCVVWFVM